VVIFEEPGQELACSNHAYISSKEKTSSTEQAIACPNTVYKAAAHQADSKHLLSMNVKISQKRQSPLSTSIFFSDK